MRSFATAACALLIASAFLIDPAAAKKSCATPPPARQPTANVCCSVAPISLRFGCSGRSRTPLVPSRKKSKLQIDTTFTPDVCDTKVPWPALLLHLLRLIAFSIHVRVAAPCCSSAAPIHPLTEASKESAVSFAASHDSHAHRKGGAAAEAVSARVAARHPVVQLVPILVIQHQEVSRADPDESRVRLALEEV